MEKNLKKTTYVCVSLEKEMATPSSILAWEIPWTEESGVLQSMGSQRVGHDWVTEPNSTKDCWVSYLAQTLNVNLSVEKNACLCTCGPFTLV